MEDLPHSKASRRGYRAHIAKINSKITEIIDSAEPITRAQRIALSIVLKQLKQKQGILKELDTKIINRITEEEELAQEICNTEEYQTILAEIAFVHDFLQATVSPQLPLSPHSATNTSTLPASLSTSSSLPNSVKTTENPSEVNTSSKETLPDTNSEAPVSTAVTKMPSGDITLNVSGDTSVCCTHHTNEAFEYATRLPKLNLPYFSGDPLTWQTFWDSFSAAVHNNPKLTGVQKFNYLRAHCWLPTDRCELSTFNNTIEGKVWATIQISECKPC